MAQEKLYVNLSPFALMTIEEDLKSMWGSDNLSGFLNLILQNCCAVSPASVIMQADERKQELEELLSDALDTKDRKNVIMKIYVREKERLLKEVSGFPRGEPIRIPLQKETSELLQSIFDERESRAYDSRGEYAKAIFETYARRARFQRELTIYQETAAKINENIEKKNAIKIRLKRSSPEAKSNIYILKPYKIVESKTQIYNYLLGYGRRAEQPEEEAKILPIRLSSIEEGEQSVAFYGSISGKIPERIKTKIEEKIRTADFEYVEDEEEDIEVKFTPRGIRHLSQWLIQKPAVKSIDEATGTVVFHCTKFQARIYLCKFGADAVVLSPARLKENLFSYYKTAAKAYAPADSNTKESGQSREATGI